MPLTKHQRRRNANLAALGARAANAVIMTRPRIAPQEQITTALRALMHYAHSLGLDARDLANTAEGRFAKEINGED